MIWVQFLDGRLAGVPGNAWQISKDVYDILEAPGKSVATLARANIIGIYKRPPQDLRQETINEVFERLGQGLDGFLERELPDADGDEAKRKILEWFESVKAEL